MPMLSAESRLEQSKDRSNPEAADWQASSGGRRRAGSPVLLMAPFAVERRVDTVHSAASPLRWRCPTYLPARPAVRRLAEATPLANDAQEDRARWYSTTFTMISSIEVFGR